MALFISFYEDGVVQHDGARTPCGRCGSSTFLAHPPSWPTPLCPECRDAPEQPVTEPIATPVQMSLFDLGSVR